MDAALERAIGERREFSIARGPFPRLLQRLHLTRSDGSPRASALVAIAWIPLLASALLRAAIDRHPAPVLVDLSVHARLLIGIPLLVMAERLLDERCRSAIGQVYDGALAERTSVDRIIDRAERSRDSRLAEVAMFALAFLVGQAALWGFIGPTGVIAGVTEAGSMSFARLWYAAVALPIAQFLAMRWLWHWAIWSYVLVRLSRLQLATIATHPDHAAGIGFLAGPISAFAGFVLAFATMLASAWATRLLEGHASVQALAPVFVAFVVVAVVVACAPLLAFMGILLRTRHRDIRRYNGLALEYVREFHRKWIEARGGTEPLLGTADLQALADLCSAYENLARVRPVPFAPRALTGIWIAAVVPMLPLVALTVPIDELLRHLGRALLGGLPR